MAAQMTFEEYWAALARLKVLPDMVIQQLPGSLSVETKKRLMKLEPEKTAQLMQEAIDEVNRGSVESIDILVKRRL